MRKYPFSTLMLGAALLFGGALTAANAQAPADEAPAIEAPAVARDTFETMMDAIEKNNYGLFASLASPRFKAALTPAIFKGLVAQLSTSLQAGYELRYLGAANKAGFVVSIWRVRFKAGGDDVLGEVSENGDGVGGFFLR